MDLCVHQSGIHYMAQNQLRKLYYSFFYCALVLTCLFNSSCMDLAANDSKHKKAGLKNIRFIPGQVYTMRGIGGVFSTGMNRLEDTLEFYYHVRTSSTIWYKARELSAFIIKHHNDKTLSGPIILIGHSLGGNDQIKVAKYLQRAGIPVALLLTIDAVSPIKVPANVKEVLNIYKPGFVPMFTGRILKAEDPAKTIIVNLDASTLKSIRVNHFTIDKNHYIQQLMLKKVLSTLKHSNTRGS